MRQYSRPEAWATTFAATVSSKLLFPQPSCILPAFEIVVRHALVGEGEALVEDSESRRWLQR